MNKWKKIINPPNEGDVVLAWSKRHGFHVGSIRKYKRPEMQIYFGKSFQPSHWMTLPNPPKIKDSKP